MDIKITARRHTDGYYYIWSNGKREVSMAYNEKDLAQTEAKRQTVK
jgi:hypothetical protein